MVLEVPLVFESLLVNHLVDIVLLLVQLGNLGLLKQPFSEVVDWVLGLLLVNN